MEETELAYTAGIIDGEGSISLLLNKCKKQKAFYQMRVTVRNTNEWLVQWLKVTYGGYFYPSHYGDEERAKNWKPQWQWAIAANKALVFLKLIYPYLRLKKPQAEVAIQFQEARCGQGHHLSEAERAIAEAERILMGNLNKRGAVKK